MLLEILIGVCVMIVIVGVASIVFYNEEEAKEQRSKRVEQALTTTIGRQEFDTQVQALMHPNAEAVRKAGLFKATAPVAAPEPRLPKVTQATPRKPHTAGYVSQAPDRAQRDADYLTSVAIASSYDNTPSRTCSSSSSSSSYSSGCSGSSSSSSSSDSGSSSSCD